MAAGYQIPGIKEKRGITTGCYKSAIWVSSWSTNLRWAQSKGALFGGEWEMLLHFAVMMIPPIAAIDAKPTNCQ